MRGRYVRGVGFLISLSMMAAHAVTAAASDGRVGDTLQDVTLETLKGQPVKLLDHHKGKVLVIAYTGLGCPIANRFAPRLEELSKKHGKDGVQFVGINANPQDSPAKIAKESGELGITFPVLIDDQQQLTRQLDAKTTTVVFVIDKDRRIQYRGMVDDQFVVGAQKPNPSKRYLQRAIRSVLAGKKPKDTRTVAPGCLITRVKVDAKKPTVTYASDVARIIQNNCQQCHRPAQIGPFPLTSYEDASGWSAMMHSVVSSGRMPPWNADAEFDGVFLNQRKLSDDDKSTLLAWIDQGMPRGNPDDDPPARKWPRQWRIGKPDKIYRMKESFLVPRDGVVEYQYFSIKTNYKKDMWISSMEARPGAPEVVHHVLAFVEDPTSRSIRGGLGLDDGFLCATVPGDTPSIFPPGAAKKLPAGATITFQMHYTPIGKPKRDKSSLGLVFADEPAQREVITRGIYNTQFTIPAGDANFEIRSDFTFKNDVELLSFFPHMHYRGKDWTYIAHFPDGTQKTLLSVTNYDFNWQESYILKTPMKLPAGTKIECIAHYDNSSANFSNPDPGKSVRWGDQTWEEMMIGYVDYLPAK